jgi:glycosyltransferase involved in cell wall biosynthesis
MTLSLIIPVYNERATLDELFARLDTLPDAQLVAVDDGSTDGSAERLDELAESRPNMEVLHKANGGKGSAIKAARARVRGDIVVIQDADLEYDPSDIPELVEPIDRGAADVVYGSRLSGGRPQRAYLFWHLVGNRFISLFAGILFNTTLTDLETGYKAFRRDVFLSLDLRADDFGIEAEITAQICKQKLRIYELPIAYYGRTYAEGKKITWRDGFRALWILTRERVTR